MSTNARRVSSFRNAAGTAAKPTVAALIESGHSQLEIGYRTMPSGLSFCETRRSSAWNKSVDGVCGGSSGSVASSLNRGGTTAPSGCNGEMDVHFKPRKIDISLLR